MFGSYLHFTFAFKKVSYFSKYIYSTSVKDMDLLKMSKLSVNKLCEKICCATKKITRNQNKYSNRIMHNCTNWKSHWINVDYWHKNQPVTKSHFTWAKISPYLKTFSLKTTQHFLLSQDIPCVSQLDLSPTLTEISRWYCQLKNFMTVFMDGVRLPQGCGATTRKQFTFY